MKLLHNMKENLLQRFKGNIYLKYSMFFLIFVLIGLLPIEIKNKSIFFSGLFIDRKYGMDGLKQHLTFLYDFLSRIKGNDFTVFRPDIGLGADAIISYTYYSLFDPLVYMGLLFPLKHLEAIYYFLIIFRLYLAGMFIIVLGKKLSVSKHSALISMALFYCFSSAILFSAFRHPMFINGPMYLPLIILGVEENKKPAILIFATFLAFITQFYFFIYITFAFVLYCVFKYWEEIKKFKLSSFIKVNIFYFLGVMLGAFVLVPQFFAIISSNRIGGKGFMMFNFLDYLTLILTNILPAAGDRYTAGIGNFFVFIICLTWIMKNPKNIFSKMFVVLLGLSFFSGFSYLINLGSYVNNRWLFLLSLPASIIVGKFLEEGSSVDINTSNKVLKILKAMIILSIVLAVGFLLDSKIKDRNLITNIIYTLITFSTILILVLVFTKDTNYYRFNKVINSKHINKFVLANSLFSLLIMSGIYCFILTPNKSFISYYDNDNLFVDALDDDSFYRIEQHTYIANEHDYSNDGIYYRYPSTSLYNSMVNSESLNILNKLNVINNNNTVGYNGFNFRTELLAINNVKYIFVRESDKVKIPYGFSKYKEIDVRAFDQNKHPYNYGGNLLKDDNNNFRYEKLTIYQNDYFLNFGFMYDEYILESQLNSSTDLQRQAILTKAIILDKSPTSINNLNKQIPTSIYYPDNIKTNNLEIISNSNGTYTISSSDNAYISFIIPKVENSEVYISIVGYSAHDKYTSYTTTYKTKDVVREVNNYGYGSNMYIENNIHLVNLGYYEYEEDLEVTINFPKGSFDYDIILYNLINFDEYASDISKLSKVHLTNFQFIKDGFTGEVDANKDGVMFFSIPYSNGFVAYLDGEEVPILKANYSYMAIEVPKGFHNIELKYQTQGLKIGIYISVASFGIITVLIIATLIFTRRKKVG